MVGSHALRYALEHPDVGAAACIASGDPFADAILHAPQPIRP